MCQLVFADILTRLMTKSLFKWHKKQEDRPVYGSILVSCLFYEELDSLLPSIANLPILLYAARPKTIRERDKVGVSSCA